jgi:adenine phosphoribosyltransferase
MHRAISSADESVQVPCCMTTANVDLAELIRTIPDFPRPGVQFRDITTLLLDAKGFHASIERLTMSAPAGVDLIAGIEARGFIFSSAAAAQLGKGLVLIRKDGKLPGATIGVDYALEYGTDRVVMHEDACLPGQKVLLVDDLIATGGTALAAVRLLRQAGAEVVGASFVIDLPDLGGAEKLRGAGVPVATLVSFEGD